MLGDAGFWSGVRWTGFINVYAENTQGQDTRNEKNKMKDIQIGGQTRCQLVVR